MYVLRAAHFHVGGVVCLQWKYQDSKYFTLQPHHVKNWTDLLNSQFWTDGKDYRTFSHPFFQRVPVWMQIIWPVIYDLKRRFLNHTLLGSGITNSIQTWNRCYSLFCLSKFDFRVTKLTPLRHRCDCAGAENAHKLEWSDYMPQFSGLYWGLAAQKPDADWDTNPHINIPGFRADRRDNLRPAKFHLLQNMKPKYYSQINPLEDLQPESTNKNKCGCFYSVKIHKLVSWSILQSFVMTACENCILVECLRSIFKFSFQVVLFLTTPLNLH